MSFQGNYAWTILPYLLMPHQLKNIDIYFAVLKFTPEKDNIKPQSLGL